MLEFEQLKLRLVANEDEIHDLKDALGYERLKREIKDECSFDGRNIKYIDGTFKRDELSLCISSKAGVISIDDQGFAEKLITILNQDN